MLKIKKITPMFDAIVTTMDKWEEDVKLNNGLIDTSKTQGTLKEYQKVLAVGTLVRDIKVGDLVWINPTRYGVKKHQEGSLKDGVIKDNPIVTYNFNVLEIDGKQCLLLQTRDIDFIINEYEEIEETPSQSSLIVPEEDVKLIV